MDNETVKLSVGRDIAEVLTKDDEFMKADKPLTDGNNDVLMERKFAEEMWRLRPNPRYMADGSRAKQLYDELKRVLHKDED